MSSIDLSDDEVPEIVREESRKAVRSEIRSYGYGVVGLVVGAVGLPVLVGSVLSENPAVPALAVLAVSTFTAFLLW